MLFPAAVLILLGLGGLALDAATIYLGQRRLADLAAAVATDAVAAVDHDAFFGERRLALSADRAAARRTQLVASQTEDRGLGAVACEVLVATDPARATAVCSAEVRPLFAPLVPGMEAVEPIRAVETAVARQR